MDAHRTPVTVGVMILPEHLWRSGGSTHLDPRCTVITLLPGDAIRGRVRDLDALTAAPLRLCGRCAVAPVLRAVVTADPTAAWGTLTRSLAPRAGVPPRHGRELARVGEQLSAPWTLRQAWGGRVPYLSGPLSPEVAAFVAPLGGYTLERWPDLPPADGRVAAEVFWRQLEGHLGAHNGDTRGFARHDQHTAAAAIAAPAAAG